MTREELIEVMARAIAQHQGEEWQGDMPAALQSREWSNVEDNLLGMAQAALAAIEAAGVRLVPSEPNENMHDAFFHTRDHAWPKHRDERRAEGKGWRTLPYAIWEAMIAASPYAPQKENNDETT